MEAHLHLTMIPGAKVQGDAPGFGTRFYLLFAWYCSRVELPRARRVKNPLPRMRLALALRFQLNTVIASTATW